MQTAIGNGDENNMRTNTLHKSSGIGPASYQSLYFDPPDLDCGLLQSATERFQDFCVGCLSDMTDVFWTALVKAENRKRRNAREENSQVINDS